MKRSIPAVALLVAAVLTLSACSSGDSVSKPKGSAAPGAAVSGLAATGSAGPASSGPATTGKQDITFVVSNEPDGLDPTITNNSFASPYLTNLFEGLVGYDAKGQLEANLAKKWEVSADGKTYTFTLRPNLKWSDGTALTAKDFEYTFFRLLDPKTAGQYVSMLTDYVAGAKELYDGTGGKEAVGIKATDDSTFVITLKAPAAQFVDVLSIWAFAPVQRKTVEANGDKWTLSADTFVTNGPFKVGAIKPGESLTMVKNEYYWDAGRTTLNSVTMRMIKDTSTALNAFKAGEVDGIRNVPTADFPKLKAEDPRLKIVTTYAASFFLMNNAKAPFDNPKVREAFNLAIDRQSLIDNVLKSSDAPAFSPIAPGYVLGGKDYADGRSTYGLTPTAQPEKAKAALAAAGFPDGQGFPEIALYYYTDPMVKLVTEAMAQMLRDTLNIKVTTPTKEWKVYFADVQAGNYQVAAMGWGADFFHPMTFFPVFKSTDPSNNTGWKNPEFDKLVDTAMVELDTTKQMALLRQAEDIVAGAYVVLPTYYRSTSFMMSDKVSGYYMTPMSALYFKHAKVTG